MKSLFILTSILLSFSTLAQEELSPLFVNSNIAKSKNAQKSGDVHNLFIYQFDTLSLPFLDDFSGNHFPDFDAQTTDPNVVPETTFRIEIGGTPVPMGSLYMDDTTFHYQYDTVNGFGFDSIVLIGKTPLSNQVAEIFDIDNYPITSAIQDVWPAYNIHDSVWDAITTFDTMFYNITTADLFQDSATIYYVESVAADTNIYWQDLNVYHNYTYAKNIQTLGVASFDGLDETGYPYDFSSVSAKGEADVLTSKPINMSGLIADDSVYFSFLVEPGGYGEVPDADDSLVLQFWSPLTQEWKTVWKKTGYTSNVFEMQLVRITSGIYFQNGFQFRFKSYGSLTGSLDVWHIDYVYLNELRPLPSTLLHDWAYSNPAQSFLKDFTSVPWPHFEFDPPAFYKDTVITKAYNSDNNDLPPASSEMYMNLYFGDNLIDSIPFQNTFQSSDAPALSYQDVKYAIPSPIWFDTLLADTCADFKIVQVISTNGVQGTELLDNDTLRHTQHFSNYYSYDDGTAEAAYGLVSAGAKLAYQYTLAPGLADTLRAVSMHFSPNTHDVTTSAFFLQIWEDDGGEPGDLIYSTDSIVPTLYYPSYSAGNNGFVEYVLPKKIVVSGTYYIGWKQSGADRLNIGFDKNINHQDKIFYKTSSNWSNTIYQGSLMMRPVFVSDKDILLSVEENDVWNPEISVYPNPASTLFNIGGEVEEIERIELYDLQGRVLTSELMTQQTFSVQNLPDGVYLIRLYNPDNQSIQKKVIISH